jgi:hypothetical protein
MNKKLKSIPKFRSEAEERRFWKTHDTSDYTTGRRPSGYTFQILSRQPLQYR